MIYIFYPFSPLKGSDELKNIAINLNLINIPLESHKFDASKLKKDYK